MKVQAAWRGRQGRLEAAAIACAPALLRSRVQLAEAEIARLAAELAETQLMQTVQDDALRLLWEQLAQTQGSQPGAMEETDVGAERASGDAANAEDS
jgi:uncharacterized coiled-coil protein SlyX